MINILGFSGEMGSGKTTLMNLVRSKLDRYVVTIKFAQPLYDIQEYVYKRTGLELEGPKDRKLLQFLGTDWGRDKSPYLWVNLWAEEVERLHRRTPHVLIMCDDIRFDNEASTVNSMGGNIIKVTASYQNRSNRIAVTNAGHKSESGISDEWVDRIVDNNGSLFELDALAMHLIETLDV